MNLNIQRAEGITLGTFITFRAKSYYIQGQQLLHLGPLLHLLHLRPQQNQLGQEWERNDEELHGCAALKSVPKQMDMSRPLFEFYQNGADKPFLQAADHQLYILEGLLFLKYRYSHLKVAWFCHLNTAVSSKQNLYVAKTNSRQQSYARQQFRLLCKLSLTLAQYKIWNMNNRNQYFYFFYFFKNAFSLRHYSQS